MGYITIADNELHAYSYANMLLRSRAGVTIQNDGPSGGVLLIGNEVTIDPLNRINLSGPTYNQDDMLLTGGVKRYAEYLGQGGSAPPANTNWGDGVYSVVSANTYNNDFSSSPGTGQNDYINITKDGIYMLQMVILGSSGMPNGEAALRTGTTGPNNDIATCTIGDGTAWGDSLFAIADIAAGQRLYTLVKFYQSWSGMQLRLRIHKVA